MIRRTFPPAFVCLLALYVPICRHGTHHKLTEALLPLVERKSSTLGVVKTANPFKKATNGRTTALNVFYALSGIANTMSWHPSIAALSRPSS